MKRNNNLLQLDSKTDLYFHMPFCVKKCGYCYFYSLEKQGAKAMDKYLGYLEKEILIKKKMWKFPEDIRAIYVGGGTPSYLPYASLEKLFKILHKHFKIDKEAEFTMEVNPSVCDKKKLKLIKKNGVNRLSFGIQTIDPRILQKIQRTFDRKRTVEIIKYAKKLKFKTINLDFMFNLPDQSEECLSRDIEFIKKNDPDSVYWYETKNVTGYMKKINDQTSSYLKFDSFISPRMKNLGYARTMTEFYSKNNKPCQYTFDFLLADYVIGFGPFSISKYKDVFSKNVSNMKKYYDLLDKDSLPTWKEFNLNNNGMAVNFLSYLLRFGSADIAHINKKFNVRLESILKKEINLLKKYNLLKQKGLNIVLTQAGVLYTPDVQIVLLNKYKNFLKNLNVFLGRGYGLK